MESSHYYIIKNILIYKIAHSITLNHKVQSLNLKIKEFYLSLIQSSKKLFHQTEELLLIYQDS